MSVRVHTHAMTALEICSQRSLVSIGPDSIVTDGLLARYKDTSMKSCERNPLKKARHQRRARSRSRKTLFFVISKRLYSL